MGSTRITVLCYGTRGDVQPLLALSVGLAQAGYQMTLAAERVYETEIRSYGLGYAPIRLELREFLASPRGIAAIRQEKPPGPDAFDSMGRPMLDDCWSAAQGADALIYDTMLTPAHHIADKLRIPSVMTSVMPNLTPTRAFPIVGGKPVGWGGWGNKLSYQVYRVLWLLAANDVRRWCHDTLGVTPPRFYNYWQRNGRNVPIAYSFSRHVLPEPADWPADTRAAGYWFLDGSPLVERPAALEAFLSKGPRPIFVTFGSMSWLPEGTAEMLLAAVVASGQRAVLQTDDPAMRARLPETIFPVSQLPYDWIAPHVSLLVFHGGSGATAATLRFGVPSVVCPSITDQYLWAGIIQQRGWGVRVLPKQWSPETIAAAIRQVARDVDMRRRVAGVSALIQRDDSLSRAIDFIGSHVARPNAVRTSNYGSHAVTR